MTKLLPSYQIEDTYKLLRKDKRIHFIGIGGSGMNPIAKILLDMKYVVSGSDIKENVYTLRLKDLGATIYYGHNESNIRLADLVVISSAIKKDNVEYQAAMEKHIPIIKRAELLAMIMEEYKKKIAISGTHGKTTVTSFISHYLSSIGEEPTYVIGSPIKNVNLASQYGKKDFFVAEADESDRSFLFLKPNILVITNIEEEHLDQFENLEDILDTFSKFIERVPEEDSVLIVNGDNDNIKRLNYHGRKVITYGLENDNTVQATNIQYDKHKISYDVTINKKKVAEQISLNIPGIYNVENSLVVFAVAHYFKLSLSQVSKSFLNFDGAMRRFHKIGEADGIVVYDDYAHHPTEIKCTLAAAKSYGKRVIAIFQPHRYSRFSAFYHRFEEALSEADFIIITDVYAAGEDNVSGLTSASLSKLFPANKVRYVQKVSDISQIAVGLIQKNDLVITLGAGDITHVSKEIYQHLKSIFEDEYKNS